MKTLIRTLAISALLSSLTFGHGVIVVDAKNGVYLKLKSTNVAVSVRNQVALTVARVTFLNNIDSALYPVFAFPLPAGASATNLRYTIDDTTYSARISPTPQDTALPGGNPTTALQAYLGPTPLYFHIDKLLSAGSTVTVELTYVQLLPYDIGSVYYRYPADYSPVSHDSIESEKFEFQLHSARTITAIQMTSHPQAVVQNSGTEAEITLATEALPSEQDYLLFYTLDLNELGLFGFSTFLDDSLSRADTIDGGYFSFVVEPNPSGTTDVLRKIFTFVIDRSGSMYGDKIVQARNAATFIVNNLNEGDLFNLIEFDDQITSFRPSPVPYTVENKTAALSFIDVLTARGMTNIAGALSTAIRQFQHATDSTANIIVFLTDGRPTEGITSTEGILHAIDTAKASNENRISIFAFGIGADVNVSLLTQIGQRNDGLAEFLQSDELESRITSFYTRIRNPVLIESEASFSTESVYEVYPDPLPNLFKGQQLIVTGRYTFAQPTVVTFAGKAFGTPVEYQYDLPLSDSANAEFQFLTKLWAKGKIDHLMIRYRAVSPASPAADSLRSEVVLLSLRYGVMSEFTSYSGGGDNGGSGSTDPGGTGRPSTGDATLALESGAAPTAFDVRGAYPNPFNPSTKIVVRVNRAIGDDLTVRIYNLLGQLVNSYVLRVSGPGDYSVEWNGRSFDGTSVPSGTYVVMVEYGGSMRVGKVLLIR